MRRLAATALLVCAPLAAAGYADVRRGFENPPDNARIMMRWWWFGSAVTKPELEREMRAMKAGGIGGFEIQPVYPLALDDPEHGFRNLPYLSPEFLDALRFTAEKAKGLGLRADITLASGWPYGGPHIPVTEAAGRLRADRVAVAAGAHRLPLPDIGAGENLLAVFLERGREFQRLSVASDHVSVPQGAAGTALFFIASRTGQQVKRAAVGAEGFVLDHYDRNAIEVHLRQVGDKLLAAFGPNPPYAVFSDSLEVYGSDWTGDLLAEFQKRRGYDLTPYLPALVTDDMGEKTDAIRHDWGKTLTELCEERYLAPLREWARRHGTRFRSQTYGIPPARLSSNTLVDLPEGEGPQWREFSPARWAASASHLYGRPVTSSETWTWLHSPVFRATPLDMKAEADLHFLEGINQLVGHGWPYSPAGVAEPGWRFYAAAVFNDHNPWWIVMPDITRYLQRISYLLRQGKPENDVAVYLPTDDAWALFRAGRDSVNELMNGLLGPDVLPQILNAGYNFDFIDDGAIEKVGVPYRAIVLPDVERMPLATLRKLKEYEQRGGMVLATRRVPSEAPGLMDAADAPAIRELARTLALVRDESTLGAELSRRLAPDFATGRAEIGFVHRKLADGELYFVVNTSNHPVQAAAATRVSGLGAQWWDPFSGSITAAARASDGRIPLDLAPYESRVLVFATERAPAAVAEHPEQPLDISRDWNVSFGSHTVRMPRLRSWTDDEDTRYFSGQASYEKTVTIPAGLASRGMWLDFGPGTPVDPPRRRAEGMRALLESPVREAAMVWVNGKLAGPVWRPPYRVEVGNLLHAGENRIRIVVANLALNEMAGKPLPNYRLLNLRYGKRFEPQDMQDVKAQPAGILGKVLLVAHGSE